MDSHAIKKLRQQFWQHACKTQMYITHTSEKRMHNLVPDLTGLLLEYLHYAAKTSNDCLLPQSSSWQGARWTLNLNSWTVHWHTESYHSWPLQTLYLVAPNWPWHVTPGACTVCHYQTQGHPSQLFSLATTLCPAACARERAQQALQSVAE